MRRIILGNARSVAPITACYDVARAPDGERDAVLSAVGRLASAM
jgi:hypothetical protein